MNPKNLDIIRIIKEELENYDFLNNDKFNIEQESINLIKNQDFQKEFICDSLLKKEKIKFKNVIESNFSNNWQETDYLNFSFIIELEYKFNQNEKPSKIGLSFIGDNIPYSLDGYNSIAGDNMTAPVDEEWFNMINWNNIEVKLFSVVNDVDIDFIAFEKAPEKIQHLFIREYIGDFISEYAGKGMKTSTDFDKPQSLNYC